MSYERGAPVILKPETLNPNPETLNTECAEEEHDGGVERVARQAEQCDCQTICNSPILVF